MTNEKYTAVEVRVCAHLPFSSFLLHFNSRSGNNHKNPLESTTAVKQSVAIFMKCINYAN